MLKNVLFLFYQGRPPCPFRRGGGRRRLCPLGYLRMPLGTPLGIFKAPFEEGNIFRRWRHRNFLDFFENLVSSLKKLCLIFKLVGKFVNKNAMKSDYFPFCRLS